jgi:tetrapyrrole methylase family protein/MazG family protein
VRKEDAGKKLLELVDVMAQLRGDHGCPWDKEQTHVSLKPCLLEEAYELLDALDEGDPEKMREELGDVLLQVIFHSQIAAEEGRFTISDVIARLTEKLVRRHPYVFAGEPIPEGTAAVLKQRLQIKASEKQDKNKSALGGVPKAMPALARAQSISRRAAHLGFEWPDIGGVWQKIDEEMLELKEAAASGNRQRTGEDRFTRRFRHIEARLREKNRTFDESSIEEMDRYWEEAKKLEAKEKSGS